MGRVNLDSFKGHAFVNNFSPANPNVGEKQLILVLIVLLFLGFKDDEILLFDE